MPSQCDTSDECDNNACYHEILINWSKSKAEQATSGFGPCFYFCKKVQFFWSSADTFKVNTEYSYNITQLCDVMGMIENCFVG